jgi:beta-glucanase (GH16 family)
VFGAWHTYGMLWTKQAITIYMDGAQLFTMATPAVAQQPMYILLDYGLGGGWPTNQTPNPSYMYVQYVRAWKAPN